MTDRKEPKPENKADEKPGPGSEKDQHTPLLHDHSDPLVERFGYHGEHA